MFFGYKKATLALLIILSGNQLCASSTIAAFIGAACGTGIGFLRAIDDLDNQEADQKESLQIVAINGLRIVVAAMNGAVIGFSANQFMPTIQQKSKALIVQLKEKIKKLQQSSSTGQGNNTDTSKTEPSESSENTQSTDKKPILSNFKPKAELFMLESKIKNIEKEISDAKTKYDQDMKELERARDKGSLDEVTLMQEKKKLELQLANQKKNLEQRKEKIKNEAEKNKQELQKKQEEATKSRQTIEDLKKQLQILKLPPMPQQEKNEFEGIKAEDPQRKHPHEKIKKLVAFCKKVQAKGFEYKEIGEAIIAELATDECSVCLEDIKSKVVSAMPCAHILCTDCCTPLKECPTCKQAFNQPNLVTIFTP